MGERAAVVCVTTGATDQPESYRMWLRPCLQGASHVWVQVAFDDRIAPPRTRLLKQHPKACLACRSAQRFADISAFHRTGRHDVTVVAERRLLASSVPTRLFHSMNAEFVA